MKHKAVPLAACKGMNPPNISTQRVTIATEFTNGVFVTVRTEAYR